MQKVRTLNRNDSRIIIHFDYDCFYASVVEHENPALKFVPLAIQQKQIVVTCNYEARRRGLHKLQLITEAKKICPDAVIVLGEDISRFRNASKELCGFLTQSVWSNQAEKLGFDEVWLDCTDMVDYNYEMLNHNDLTHSFFCMDKGDPTVGFEYDASLPFGCTYPKRLKNDYQLPVNMSEEDRILRTRLILGSHLARHLRHELEAQKGYTATVGIATNKLLSKLVGNVNKPENQTTLMPPYDGGQDHEGSVTEFMDPHDIGKVPGIGFKLAQKIRAHVLHRPADYHAGLVYGGTKENVIVKDVRLFPAMGPELMEEILSGPGSQKGIGGKLWALLHGVDESEVGRAKKVPSQISQEDSYMKYLHTFEQVRQQLVILTERLIRRMHIDLTEEDDDGSGEHVSRRWLAHPRTLRLSTRPRPPISADGTRPRTFHRISRSAPMPNSIFNLNETPSTLADKVVEEALIPMFRKLHPQRSGWNLSLINVAVTNMAETATDSKDSEGRNIGKMFRRQDDVLKDFRITETEAETETETRMDDVDAEPFHLEVINDSDSGTTDQPPLDMDEQWQSDEGDSREGFHKCHFCAATVPLFAADAHERFHLLADE